MSDDELSPELMAQSGRWTGTCVSTSLFLREVAIYNKLDRGVKRNYTTASEASRYRYDHLLTSQCDLNVLLPSVFDVQLMQYCPKTTLIEYGTGLLSIVAE